MATDTSAGQVFIRRSSGLTRQITAWDALMYCAMNPGLLFSFVYVVWTPYLYPGAHMSLAVLMCLQMFPIAGLYWLFSVSMARSGGEYVYVSRILHPALGLMCSFVVSITAFSWFGVLMDWWLKWAFVDLFRGIGIINGSAGWLNVADFFDQQWTRAIIGTLAILLAFYIFLHGAKWMMRLSWITVALAWLGIIVFGVAVAIGANQFAGNFTALTGVDYNTIIPIAEKGGYLASFTLVGTIMGGSTYVVLNTLGQTFSANMAGEIRGVQKSQMIAMFGSLTMLMVIWAIGYQLFYVAFGDHWTNSLMYLFNSGDAAYPFPGHEPMITLLIGILTKNPIFVVLIGICFFMATYVSGIGLGFAPTRNLFAWAFDRMIPPKLAELDKRYRSPWRVIIIACLAGWIFFMVDVFAPVWTANIGYTIIAWFTAWIVVGVAGILFPYIKKDLYESSPPIVKSRFIGVPVVTWLGALTVIISGSIDYYMFIPIAQGKLPMEAIYMTVGFIVAPFFLYGASRLYYSRRGVSLGLQFTEVPPE